MSCGKDENKRIEAWDRPICKKVKLKIGLIFEMTELNKKETG